MSEVGFKLCLFAMVGWYFQCHLIPFTAGWLAGDLICWYWRKR